MTVVAEHRRIALLLVVQIELVEYASTMDIEIPLRVAQFTLHLGLHQERALLADRQISKAGIGHVHLLRRIATQSLPVAV